MDSECDLDIVIERASPPPPVNSNPFAYKFYIKIYKNGNVHIKQQGIDSYNNTPHSSIRDLLVIKDGISFPPDVISMLKILFDMRNEGNHCLSSCRNIFESIKLFQKELVKAQSPPDIAFMRREYMAKINKIEELARESAQKDKKISLLEKQLEHIREEVVTKDKKICQLLSDGHAARLGADKKIDDLVKCQDKEIDKLEGIVTQKHKESASQAKRIDELERLVAKIRELEKDPTDAELDIRAKEGAKKHAEAKAKLQKLYEERPMVTLVEGESIGSLLANECIRDLLVCM